MKKKPNIVLFVPDSYRGDVLGHQGNPGALTPHLDAQLAIAKESGAAMYLVEGPQNGFTSIPRASYWAIVTLTTVGYGDIAPQTPLGKILASIIMIMGYGIIAVPTGIVSVELAGVTKKRITTQACPECSCEGHDDDAKHCKSCGSEL